MEEREFDHVYVGYGKYYGMPCKRMPKSDPTLVNVAFENGLHTSIRRCDVKPDPEGKLSKKYMRRRWATDEEAKNGILSAIGLSGAFRNVLLRVRCADRSLKQDDIRGLIRELKEDGFIVSVSGKGTKKDGAFYALNEEHPEYKTLSERIQGEIDAKAQKTLIQTRAFQARRR